MSIYIVNLKSSVLSHFQKYKLYNYYFVFHIKLSQDYCLIIFIIVEHLIFIYCHRHVSSCHRHVSSRICGCFINFPEILAHVNTRTCLVLVCLCKRPKRMKMKMSFFFSTTINIKQHLQNKWRLDKKSNAKIVKQRLT